MSVIDYGQETLFGKKVISSVNYDEQEIIRDILFLHCNGGSIDVDCTYSIGNFYKKGLPEPKLKFDLNPKTKDTVYADCRELPLENESVHTLMFDPPFIVGDNADGKENLSLIRNRFGHYTNVEQLWEMYNSAIQEFSRVICNNGILIFKCQDTVSSGKNYFSHVEVMTLAVKNGFYPKDLFIYVAKNRITDIPIDEQQHARKFHSYFWVFQKRKSKVNYMFRYPEREESFEPDLE